MRPLEWVQGAQRIDRRIVYAAVFVILALPFLIDYRLPIYPDTYTRLTFDTLEQIANDPVQREKTVLILSNWGPGSDGENGPQIQVLFRHLLRRRVRFVLLSTAQDPLPIALAQARLRRAIEDEQRRARRLGQPVPEWVYGEDYMNFGFRPAPVFEPIAETLVMETRAFFQRDYLEQKPLTDQNFPLLRNFHGVADISLVLVVSHTDEAKALCGIVQRQVPELKVAEATMGIVANDLYPYVKSGQLSGLLNSARAAAEYRSLLDPDASMTTPADNSMSLGKLLLLGLVVLGNLAYLVVRRAQAAGKLRPGPTQTTPMRPLPARVLMGFFAVFLLGYLGCCVLELYRDVSSGTMPRTRVARADDDPGLTYPDYERVDIERLRNEQADAFEDPGADPDGSRAAARADAEFARLVEMRIGAFIAALMTMGIFAFLLGDNRLYRFTEAIMIGGGLAYVLLEQWTRVLKPMWIDPILTGVVQSDQRWGLLWLVMLVPGSLWYFVYSRRYRWANQIVVALFIGAAIGPEFQKQVGNLIPHIIDSIQPVWPFAPDPQSGATVFRLDRFEHLVFVVVMVLSLLYFIFLFRPRTRLGWGVSRTSRLTMMIGFGAMFGNTVNTRLAWLAPRIGFLLEDWLGKLLGT